jgi:hypothetical protein
MNSIGASVGRQSVGEERAKEQFCQAFFIPVFPVLPVPFLTPWTTRLFFCNLQQMPVQ